MMYLLHSMTPDLPRNYDKNKPNKRNKSKAGHPSNELLTPHWCEKLQNHFKICLIPFKSVLFLWGLSILFIQMASVLIHVFYSPLLS